MELFLGILLLIAAAFVLSILWIFHRESEDIIPSALLGATCMLLTAGGVALLQEHFDPAIRPIDVYKGKTTLEITYRDSIAIDSVVVWKEEIR